MAIKDMYLTISEVAEELEVSKQTIYRWLAEKKFPSEKIGGVVFVDKKSVLEYKVEETDKSFFQFIGAQVGEFIKKEYKYSDQDEIKKASSEDDYITLIVKKENGKSEKIKIGSLEITFVISREPKKSGIRSMKFKDTSITEYEESQEKEEGNKENI